MQLIEKNSFNVRTAYFKMESRFSQLSFLVLPVIHIGPADYYDKINELLQKTDTVLYEDVKSRRSRLLVMTYSIVNKMKRIKMITQDIGIPFSKFRNKLIWNDISEAEFNLSWSQIPLGVRFLMGLLIPFYVLFFYFFGNKGWIARDIALDDLPTSRQIADQAHDLAWNKLDHLIVHKRDQRIIEKIDSYYLEQKDQKKEATLLYGARHMIAIMHYLASRGFTVTESGWIKVFDL